MKVETHITVHLTQAENDALKRLLGLLSPKGKSGLGLTAEESKITSEIYDYLPHPNEET